MNSLKQAPHPLTTLTLRARLPLLALAVLAAAVVSNQGPALATGGTRPDTEGYVGEFNSLELDAAGRPVVSYYDRTNHYLKVMHCNDVNCAGGGESITSPDTAGDVSEFSSLVLDASGRPVIGYLDRTNADLKVMHCSDANCAVAGKDTDGDLLPDPVEQGLRQCPSSNDADSDNDFLTDGFEENIGSNICARDTDRDGLTDGAEACISAPRGSACPHLLDRDSDGDGYTDGQDTNYCSRASHPSSTTLDAQENTTKGDTVAGYRLAAHGNPKDTDGDLLPDSFEATLRLCPGSNDADSDNDFLKDGLEAYIGSNICASDTDRDGLTDGAEIYISALRHSSCPHLLDRDSDGDGWTDGREQIRGTSYCNRLSHP